MDKKVAKIKALIEIEFDALTSDKDELAVMVREKFHRAMRGKITLKQLHIADYGDFKPRYKENSLK